MLSSILDKVNSKCEQAMKDGTEPMSSGTTLFQSKIQLLRIYC